MAHNFKLCSRGVDYTYRIVGILEDELKTEGKTAEICTVPKQSSNIAAQHLSKNTNIAADMKSIFAI